MNYNSLKDQISAYTNRNEPNFLNNIPALINQAMSRIYSEAKTIGFQKTIEGQMVASFPFVAKPLDYKATINFQYTDLNSNVIFLLPRSYEFCVNYWPEITNDIGFIAPAFYSADLDVPQNDAGRPMFYISPTPGNIQYPYKLTYLSFPPLFNEQNSENFLTDKYPNLLLYACMVEAIPFLKSDERAGLFKSLYNEALQSVNKDTKERYTDRTTNRDKD